MAEQFKIAGFALVDDFEGKNLKDIGSCLYKNNIVPIIIGLKKGRNVVDKEKTMMTEIDLTFARARTQIDVLILADDFSVSELKNHNPFRKLVEKMVKENQLVVAIGKAPVMFAQTGVVSGRNVTSKSVVQKELRQAGANIVKKDIVVDGNIITAKTNEQSRLVCNEITKKLQKKAA